MFSSKVVVAINFLLKLVTQCLQSFSALLKLIVWKSDQLRVDWPVWSSILWGSGSWGWSRGPWGRWVTARGLRYLPASASSTSGWRRRCLARISPHWPRGQAVEAASTAEGPPPGPTSASYLPSSSSEGCSPSHGRRLSWLRSPRTWNEENRK